MEKAGAPKMMAMEDVMKLDEYDRLKTLRHMQGMVTNFKDWTPEMARELMRLEEWVKVNPVPEYTQRALNDQGTKQELTGGQQAAVINETYRLLEQKKRERQY